MGCGGREGINRDIAVNPSPPPIPLPVGEGVQDFGFRWNDDMGMNCCATLGGMRGKRLFHLTFDASN